MNVITSLQSQAQLEVFYKNIEYRLKKAREENLRKQLEYEQLKIKMEELRRNMTTDYVLPETFNKEKSNIMIAPTGSGKSSALIEYLQTIDEQVVLVSPLNTLSTQLSSKAKGRFIAINCETKTTTVKDDLRLAIIQGKSVIISLTTFIECREWFYDTPVYIDEAHLTIEYIKMISTKELIKDISRGHFRKITLMTATPLGLDYLFEDLQIVDPLISLKYKRHIDLFKIEKSSIKYRLGCLLDLHREKGKLVVLLNDKTAINELANELRARSINVKIFNSEIKEIKIKDEKFTEDYDIILCTSSLTTGVSLREDFYSVYFMMHHDTINTIPQFFSRNRNKNSYGCIIKNKYYDGKASINCDIDFSKYVEATKVNKDRVELILDKLTMTKYLINEKNLTNFLNEEYLIKEENREFNREEELLIEQRFEQSIENQKDYFLKHTIPSFNKGKYQALYRLYVLWNIYTGTYVEDDVLNDMLKCDELSEISKSLDREEFYDEYYAKVYNYKHYKAVKLAGEATEESVDIDEFEELFLNKPYVKKNFKQVCIEKFAIREDVFKNKSSIDIFLEKIGYAIRKSGNTQFVRKNVPKKQ